MKAKYFQSSAWRFLLQSILAGSAAFSGSVTAQADATRDYTRYLETDYFDEYAWPRHFRIGALVGFNLEASFRMNGTFNVPGINPGPTGVSGVNHEYADGFVRVDASGNNDQSTWYWGYQNANQYDPVAETLTFTAINSYTASGQGSEKGDPEIGLDVAYGGHLFRWRRALVGWEFGFGYLPLEIKQMQGGTSTVDLTTHTYDVSGVVIPQAPYQGTYNGPGVLISDVASGGTMQSTVNLLSARTLDMTLFTFRLGPTLHWELHPRWAVAVSAGAAMGVVTGDAIFDDQLALASGPTTLRTTFGETELIYGGYFSATVMYHVEDHGDVYVGFQYMPLSDANFSSAGREARLNTSGAVYFMAGVNWPF